MTSLTRRGAMALLPVAALLAGCETTRTKPTATATAASSMSADDQQFVTDAFNIIEFDRQECTIAQTQAKTPEVRALAADFLQQANAFDARLRPIAAAAGLQPPNVLRRDLRVRATRLRLGQGLDFDRSFIEDQIASHQDTLNLQETVMETPGSNADLQELSRQGTAILKANLARLHEVQAKMMTSRRR